MVYEPREDSFLIQEQVIKYCKDKSVLDMGTGSGILAITVLNNKAKSVTAVDKDEEVVDKLKEKNLNINVIKSDLFTNVKGVFDLIIFNPPYLPRDEDNPDDLDLSGGIKGNELTIKFLKQAKEFLSKNGIIIMILSSLSNPFETYNYAQIFGYEYKTLSEQMLAFETIYCVKFSL